MPILPRIRGVLRSLAGRGPVDRDLDADVRGYFDLLVEEKIASGVSEDEARRRSRLEMGGVEQVKEAVRAARPAALADTLLRDVRYSVRLLSKSPGFSATAVLVLALGIGANTAVFTVIDVLCFRPLPGAATPGEAVAVYKRDAARPDVYRSFTYDDYRAIRRQVRLFDHVTSHTFAWVALTSGDTSRRTKAVLTTGSYFAALGVRLAAGRSFSSEEERPGSRAAVMVLSHPFWQKLGSPPDIVGKAIPLNSRPFTVIGIAPEGFAGRMVLAGPEFWLPLGAAPLLASPPAEASPLDLMVVGRLKPEVTTTAANAALSGVSGGLAPSPDGSRHLLSVKRLSRFNESSRPDDDGEAGLLAAFGALTGAALVVLIIASLNVANMQLARGSSRRKEIAMRLALGAGRGRIVGQLMTEGLMLAGAGGALGMAASVWALHGVLASLTLAVPDAVSADVTPDWRVAVACLGFCTLAALAFGLGPSLRLSRVDLVPEMRSQEGTGAGAGLRWFGIRNLLVAGQVALSLALLAASGLFVRAALAAGEAEPGYSFDRQYLLRLDAAAGGLDEAAARSAYARLIDRIRATPGVESAAIASNVAFANESVTRRVRRLGAPGDAREESAAGAGAICFDVGAAYFDTLRIPVIRGRGFTLAEERDPAAPAVAIIDEPLAAALFSGGDPIGQFVQLSAGRTGQEAPPLQVVGVARGTRHRLSDPRPLPHVYLPLGSRNLAAGALNVHVRAAAGGNGGPEDLRAALRDTVRGADTGLAVLGIQTLDEARDSRPMNWIVGAAARTFGGFGLIALFMAGIGLFGVKAYLVARRTREIGIRMAVGAGEGDIVRMVLKEGAVLLAASLAVGFVLALGVGQAVSSLLVGVHSFDPVVLVAATSVLSAAVLAACYVPARRAARVSPVTALRVE